MSVPFERRAMVLQCARHSGPQLNHAQVLTFACLLVRRHSVVLATEIASTRLAVSHGDGD